ncbi:putative nicalin precursor [Paratrimastix pyriformis]|uniref:BOS complex subunit NCLN n=1 Tax=Paratrimastix pyriformis TaxID=342808 RepID=A0ABQ8UQJ0_9EUKA|nr:putative nicalin precursor [Paratrimastix pyriformis]
MRSIAPLLVVCFFTAAFAASNVVVHRMAQYDLPTIGAFGSRSSALSLSLSPFTFLDADRDVTVDFFTNLTKPGLRVKGYLFLVPSTISSASRALWKQFEPILLQKNTSFPIYFALETPELRQVYDAVHTGDHTFEKHVFSVRGSPQAVGSPKTVNIQGWLRGSGSVDLPTIVLAAHYDSFGLVPGMSVGADRPTSGVTALLEISRVLSRIFGEERSRPAYNVLFLLCGGSTLNYAGIQQWAESQRIAKLESVLLLDGIADGSLHVRTVDSTAPRHLTESLSAIAKKMGVQLSMEKTPMPTFPARKEEDTPAPSRGVAPQPTVFFQNMEEALLAALPEDSRSTSEIVVLSGFPSSPNSSLPAFLSRADFLDTESDVSLISRNTHMILEALIRQIWPNAASLIEASDAVPTFHISEEALASWQAFLSGPSGAGRVSPFVDAHHPALVAITKNMGETLRDVTLQAVATPRSVLFFGPLSRTGSIDLARPYAFHVIVALCVIAYNAAIFCGFKFLPSLSVVRRLFAQKAGKQ